MKSERWLSRSDKQLSRIEQSATAEIELWKSQLRCGARQPYTHNATALLGAIGEFHRSPVPFGDLPTEDQPDTASLRLGCIKRNKGVAGIHESRTAVLNCKEHI